MKYDVALMSSYHGDPLSPEWFFTLKELGKKCVIITPNPNEHYSLLNQNVDSIYLNDFAPESIPDISTIEKYFNAAGVVDFKAYILNEQAYYHQSLRTITKMAYKYLKAFEVIFSKFELGCILHFTQGGEIVRRVPTLLALRNHIPVIYLGESFIPGTMTLYSDEMRTLINPEHVRTLSRSDIDDIIRSKLEKKAVVSYDADKRSHKPIAFYKRILNHIRDENWYILKAYFIHKRFLYIDPTVKRLYLRCTGIYQSPDMTNENYFYYPLNVGAESELYIRNPNFIDQVGAVERLSAHLPDGHKLYVKTHPSKEGLLSIRDYHRLKKLKNVKVLDPKWNSYELVQQSKGVLLVSGTIAQEAYLMRKPVCIMGHWPFKHFGQFVTDDSIPRIFEKLLSFNSDDINPHEFIQNLNKYSVLGSAYSNKQDFDKLVSEILLLIDRKLVRSGR